MVRVRLGAFITDLRGKVGGQYFRHGIAGTSLCNISHTRSATPSQMSQASFFSQINNAWFALSDAERSDWNDYSIFANFHQKNNPALNINGFNCFSSINFRRLCYSIPLMTTAPTVATVPAACTLTIQIGVAGLQLDADRSLVDADEFIFLKITPPISKTVNDNSSLLRMLPVVTTDDNHWHINADYITMFGAAPASGDCVDIYSAVISLVSGLSTAWTYLKTTL